MNRVQTLLAIAIVALVIPLGGCGEEDCSGNGANCRLIVQGTEPACCEGLSCQDAPADSSGNTGNIQICR